MTNQAEHMISHNLLSGIDRPVYLNKPQFTEDTLEDPEDQTNEEASVENQDPGSNEDTHDWKTRHNNLKGYYDKKLSKLESDHNELIKQNLEIKTALKQAQTKPSLPKTPEDIARFKENYPDLYDLVLSIAGSQKQQVEEELSEKIEELRNTTKQIQSEKAWKELKKLHPDVDTIKDDGRFISWFNEQPREVRALIESTEVRTVARGLDLYKRDTGQKTNTEKKEEKKDASYGVKTNSRIEVLPDKKVWKASEVAKMKPREFGKYEQEIDLALRENRFLHNE